MMSRMGGVVAGHRRRAYSARGILGLILLLAGSVAALAAETYVSPGDIDLVRYLPSPPAADSVAERQDMEVVLAIQQARTAPEIREAQADQLVSVFRFADVLGAGFSADRVPRTAALAQNACRQAAAATAAAKRFWNRPRPFMASKHVTPVIGRVTEGSYPSGHATCGYLWAILLADLVPEKKDDLFERGIRYGMNRVVGGVHYPSDVEAGRLSAAVFAAALFANERFRAEVEAARTELRSALGYSRAAAGF